MPINIRYAYSALGVDQTRRLELRDYVYRMMMRYYQHEEQASTQDLHELVMSEIEAALLECALSHFNHNQSKIARLLGLNRATLRKKLVSYQLV